ncbi:Uncharacterized protein CG43867,Pleckstrin homology domain-containing family H member 1,Pleckstrin homology domain-containing family H member 2 [Acanthosepion pharaonis]|uniref:Uncharacterized protein CG43867,Pleckstrin homology domain-containing family H member 1,Pleckstrin homology domain-containing family H member 2 n=1 Tax=Acanthosepion pharaonis TaxID=158019 RepID=A0A812C6E0_ACAPH|nr:Uncharacterized protein CG43867,Pleckstrin homology domain-containing family H member 1,Pleckstrin homology domain-containing family H member 2 [Sepia pharaonis]
MSYFFLFSDFFFFFIQIFLFFFLHFFFIFIQIFSLCNFLLILPSIFFSFLLFAVILSFLLFSFYLFFFLFFFSFINFWFSFLILPFASFSFFSFSFISCFFIHFLYFLFISYIFFIFIIFLHSFFLIQFIHLIDDFSSSSHSLSSSLPLPLLSLSSPSSQPFFSLFSAFLLPLLSLSSPSSQSFFSLFSAFLPSCLCLLFFSYSFFFLISTFPLLACFSFSLSPSLHLLAVFLLPSCAKFSFFPPLFPPLPPPLTYLLSLPLLYSRTRRALKSVKFFQCKELKLSHQETNYKDNNRTATTTATAKTHIPTGVKNGMTRRCWCVLLGRHFLYYKTPTDKTPLGQMNLRDARLEEIEHPDESDEDSSILVVRKHVIAIWLPLQGPTYLIIPTKQEKDSWLYHLTVAAGGGTGNVGTEYEQLVAKVMEVGGNLNSMYWKHPKMLHTKEPISSPMTTLPSEELQERAVDLFKLVFQFMNAQIDTRSLDYHVSLAQTILGLCIDHPQLQNELYCQLVRQTSRHPVQSKMGGVQNLLLCGKHSWFICDGAHKSPSSSVMDLRGGSSSPCVSHCSYQNRVSCGY